ncbi:MAG TPA: hypothetical protein VIL18_06560 [Longimicrobiales bacterium]
MFQSSNMVFWRRLPWGGAPGASGVGSREGSMLLRACVLSCVLLVAPACLHGQSSDDAAVGRVAIRVVGGYGFSYRREFGGRSDPIPRPGDGPVVEQPWTAWEVEGRPALGAELDYAVTARVGLRAGVLYRAAGQPVLPCPPNFFCLPVPLNQRPALWIARFGLTWAPLEALPLRLSAAPLWIHYADEGPDGVSDHPGLGLGADLEFPMRAPRFAVYAGLADDIVFWRNETMRLFSAGSRPAPRPSHLMTFRVGLVFRP